MANIKVKQKLKDVQLLKNEIHKPFITETQFSKHFTSDKQILDRQIYLDSKKLAQVILFVLKKKRSRLFKVVMGIVSENSKFVSQALTRDN